MKVEIIQLAILFFTVLFMFNSYLASAENFGCQVKINPENPTELDEVEVSISFYFRTDPPRVVDFGPAILNGNVFSVNVTVLMPRKDEFVLQMIHVDNSTYHLGRLDSGNYIFEVHVKTIHGSEQFWLEKKVEFNVTPPDATTPEFPSSIGLLLMLILTATFVLAIKSFSKHKHRDSNAAMLKTSVTKT